MARYIDADKFKSQVAAVAMSQGYPTDKAIALCDLIDKQPTAIDPQEIITKVKHTMYQVNTETEEYETNHGFVPTMLEYSYRSRIVDTLIAAFPKED